MTTRRYDCELCGDTLLRNDDETRQDFTVRRMAHDEQHESVVLLHHHQRDYQEMAGAILDETEAFLEGLEGRHDDATRILHQARELHSVTSEEDYAGELAGELYREVESAAESAVWETGTHGAGSHYGDWIIFTLAREEEEEEEEEGTYSPPTDTDGTITKYAWPGGYRVWYITHDGAELCAECVEEENDQTLDPTDNTGWRVVGHFHEGETDEAPMCDHCARTTDLTWEEEEEEPRPYTYWVCVDCYYAVNGLDPAEGRDDQDEEHYRQHAEKFESFTRSTGVDHISVGMMADEHDEECPNFPRDDQGERYFDGSHDETCEQQDFSWSPCELCGSSLGGTRHAVTVWEDTPS